MMNMTNMISKKQPPISNHMKQTTISNHWLLSFTVRSENDFKKQPPPFICNTQDHAAYSLSKMTTDCTWTTLTLLQAPSDLTAQNKHDATTQQSFKHDNNNNKETEQYKCILERIDSLTK